MPEVSGKKTRSVARPLVLSLIGAALVSPVAVMAGDPGTTPAWLLEQVGGVPLLSMGLLLLMAGLVGVAMLCLNSVASQDA